MTRRTQATFTCPNCGAEVPVDAAACPECGSDEDTGWSEDTAYDELDLPDAGWDDEETDRSSRASWVKVIAAVLVVLVVLFVLISIW